MNILQALAVNKSLPLLEKHLLIQTTIEKKLIGKWNRIRFIKPIVHILVTSLNKLEYRDSGFFKKAILAELRMGNHSMENLIQTYELLHDLSKKVGLGMSLVAAGRGAAGGTGGGEDEAAEHGAAEVLLQCGAAADEHVRGAEGQAE